MVGTEVNITYIIRIMFMNYRVKIVTTNFIHMKQFFFTDIIQITKVSIFEKDLNTSAVGK